MWAFLDYIYLKTLQLCLLLKKVDKKAYVGTMVGNLNALVSSRREKFIYNFQNAPGNFPFYINSATGEIFVISQLNKTNQVCSKCIFVIVILIKFSPVNKNIYWYIEIKVKNPDQIGEIS